MQRDTRGLFRNAALLLLALVLPLALLEFFLAALDFGYHPALVVPLWGGRNDREMLSSDGQYQPHPHWFWELRPGALLDPATGETVSPSGLRGPEPDRQPGARTRVAALGDSSTFGLSVGERETFARRLAREQDLEVLNFGVPGFSAFQGLQLYRGRVRGFQPEIVIAAFGAVNEVSPRDPNAEERFRLTSEQSPWLFSASNALMRFRSFQLLRYVLARVSGRDALAETSRERFFANLERRERGEPYVRNVDVPTFRRVLRELVEEAGRDGARVLLVDPPRSPGLERRTPELLEYSAAIAEVAADTSAALCPVRTAFRESGDPRLLLDGVHPSGRGHRLYAETLARCLEREGWLESAS